MPIRDVGDAMREAPRKGWPRKQAIAVGLDAERKFGKDSGDKGKRPPPFGKRGFGKR